MNIKRYLLLMIISLMIITLMLLSLACSALINDSSTDDNVYSDAVSAETSAGGVRNPDSSASPAAIVTSSGISAGPRGDLSAVDSWLYVLDVNLDNNFVDDIVASTYDLVVLDYIPSEENNTDYPMAGVISRLHDGPNPKLVLAYIDIGEAESYRTYWLDDWEVGDPEWIAGEDPDGWEENYPVAYWYDDWRDIWLNQNGLIQAIDDDGFDGIYLDWVEAYSDENVLEIAARDGVEARQEMVGWVSDLAESGRARRPEFLVVAQNAAELVEDDHYLGIIDAIAQEQTWFDGGADNEPPGDCPLPRTEDDIDTRTYRDSLSSVCRRQYDKFPDSTLHVSSEWYLDYLEKARDKGLVIFTVDYALEAENVAWIYDTARDLGFVPFVSSRALDLYLEPFGE